MHKCHLPYFSKKGGGKSEKKSGNLWTSSISHILAKRVEASLRKNREIRAQFPNFLKLDKYIQKIFKCSCEQNLHLSCSAETLLLITKCHIVLLTVFTLLP